MVILRVIHGGNKMKMLKLFLLGMVMMLMVGGTALAQSCSSTNYLLEGEESTYLAGKANHYQIKNMLVGYSSETNTYYARFEVNGQLTAKVYEGDSTDFDDGTILTIENVIYQNYAGGIRSAQFCINGMAMAELEEDEEDEIENVVEYQTPVDSEVLSTDRPQGNIDLSNVHKLFLTEGTYDFNAYFVVGANAPAIDNLAMTDIAMAYGSNGVEIVSVTKLDSEVSNPLKINLISIGGACENTVTDDLLGHPYTCTKGLTEGQGRIRLANYNGYAQLSVDGYTKEDTRKAAKLLNKYISEMLSTGDSRWDLRGTEIIVEGSVSNPILLAPGEQAPELVSEIETEMPPEEITCTTEQRICNDGRAAKKVSGSCKQLCPEDNSPSPIEVTSPAEKCDGCQVNGNCLPLGTRLVEDEKAKYCDIYGKLKGQEKIEGVCQNNYECLSNQCSNGNCIDLSGQLEETQGLIKTVINWFKNIFG
jgi:hypothetical protein